MQTSTTNTICEGCKYKGEIERGLNPISLDSFPIPTSLEFNWEYEDVKSYAM